MATGTEIAARLRELADTIEDISDDIDEHQLSTYTADQFVDRLTEEVAELKEQIDDLSRDSEEADEEAEADE